MALIELYLFNYMYLEQSVPQDNTKREISFYLSRQTKLCGRGFGFYLYLICVLNLIREYPTYMTPSGIMVQGIRSERSTTPSIYLHILCTPTCGVTCELTPIICYRHWLEEFRPRRAIIQ